MIKVLLINELEFVFINDMRAVGRFPWVAWARIEGTFMMDVEATILARLDTPNDEGLEVVDFLPMVEEPKKPQKAK